MRYKACKQAERTVDEYSNEFQQLWWKIDPQRMMPMESVLADYLSELDPNIAILVYDLASLTIDDAIDKAKKVELEQMSASNALQANARLQQLEHQNFLLNSQIMQMQGQGTETPRPQGSAAQKKWTNSWDKSQHEQWRANQTCYNCGKKGHIRPDCKAKPQQGNQTNQRRPGNQRQTRSRFTGNCHNCGKPGHKQAECRTRINTLEFYQEPETESESEEEEVLREHETVRNTMINRRQVHFGGLPAYNAGSDLFYQMSNATFGDLARVPKYRRQMQEAIRVASKKNNQGEESETSEREEEEPKKPLKKTSIRKLQPERVKSQPTFRLYGKVGRQNIQMLIDTGAELTVCTKKLADKIGLTYRQDKVIELITVDGKKNRTCGVAEEANIKIADAMVPMNIHIVDSKDETFLIGRDWLNRYQADLSYGKKEVTFKAQGRKITVKLTTNQPKQKVNYLGVSDSPPPPYQPTIEISDDESDDKSVLEIYINARSRITENLNDLEQRERREQQAIFKKDLENKINVWMVKCEEMKQTIR